MTFFTIIIECMCLINLILAVNNTIVTELLINNSINHPDAAALHLDKGSDSLNIK